MVIPTVVQSVVLVKLSRSNAKSELRECLAKDSVWINIALGNTQARRRGLSADGLHFIERRTQTDLGIRVMERTVVKHNRNRIIK